MRIGATPAALIAAIFVAGAIVAGDDTNATAGVAVSGGVAAVAVSPATGRVLVGIGGRKPGALWWSDDQGAHWHAALGLGKASGVTALAFSQSQPNIAYAGVIWDARVFGSGVLVSNDGGANWHAVSWKQQVDPGLPAAIDELVVDPSDPGIVYADTHGVLRRTLDGGATWAVARRGLPWAGRPFKVIDVSPRDQQFVADGAGTLYFATGLASGTGQIYRSTSHAASWQPAGQGLPSAPPGARLLQLASDVTGTPGLVYAAGSLGVYALQTVGATWTRILRARALTVRAGPAAVFALVRSVAGNSLLRRTDTGAWTHLAAPAIDEFVLDPANSSQLYAWGYREDQVKQKTIECARIYSSSDGGATWMSIGDALPLSRLNCGSG